MKCESCKKQHTKHVLKGDTVVQVKIKQPDICFNLSDTDWIKHIKTTLQVDGWIFNSETPFTLRFIKHLEDGKQILRDYSIKTRDFLDFTSFSN